MSDELQAPESPATAGVEATGAAAEATASPAETTTAAPETSTPNAVDFDALLKDRRLQGYIGSRIDQARREAERAAEERAYQRFLAEQQAREAEQRLREMDGEEFKAAFFQKQEMDRIAAEIAARKERETHSQWVARLLRGVPEEVQYELRSQAVQQGMDEDGFHNLVVEWKAQKKAEAELAKRLAAKEKEMEEKYRLKDRRSSPRQVVADGTPVGEQNFSLDAIKAMSPEEFSRYEQEIYRAYGIA